MGFLRRRLPDLDTSEDLFQAGLLKALRAAPEIADDEQLISWFVRVLRNAVIDHYRASSANDRRIDSIAAALDAPIGPEDEREICACLGELIPDLTPAYRELIEEMDLGGVTTMEMAQRLGIEPNNLKVRHHRARTQLRGNWKRTAECAPNTGVSIAPAKMRSHANDSFPANLADVDLNDPLASHRFASTSARRILGAKKPAQAGFSVFQSSSLCSWRTTGVTYGTPDFGCIDRLRESFT